MRRIFSRRSDWSNNMLLVIDAGNTNVVFAVFDGEKLAGQWRISSDAADALPMNMACGCCR